MPSERIAWIDVAKGISIALIVTMHATLGVQEAFGREGYMAGLVSFAQPVRIPAFFLLSGLLLSKVIDRDWRTYLDRRFVHFAYFYLLWLAIQATLKSPALVSGEVTLAQLAGFARPAGTLWFIVMLPAFFLATKALRALPGPVLWLEAAGLQLASLDLDFTIAHEFAGRYVYFVTGYLMAPSVVRLAGEAAERPALSTCALAVWGLLNWLGVERGWTEIPGLKLGFGLMGAAAIVVGSAVLIRWLPLPARLLGHLGARSIVVFLAFFVPVVATRLTLLRLAPELDPGTLALACTIAGIVGPLVLEWAVKWTPARFLFERPRWARLAPSAREAGAARSISTKRPLPDEPRRVA